METATFRNALLKYCMENGIPGKVLLPLIEPMRGKTDAEKEQIAKEILENFQSKDISTILY